MHVPDVLLLGVGRERYVYLLFWRMQRNSNEPFTVAHHEHFTVAHPDEQFITL